MLYLPNFWRMAWQKINQKIKIMKFYKIVNPAGHNGLVYHEGLNLEIVKYLVEQS